MRVCVTATSDDLDAQVDPRFGRCQYFVVVDTETMKFEAVRNESADAPGGAGIQAAQTVASLGVDAVITGNVGPNAFQTLSAAGIKVFTGAHGTVKNAVEMLKRNELGEAGNATVTAHFGLGSAPTTPPAMPPAPPILTPGFGGGGKGRGRGKVWQATGTLGAKPSHGAAQELARRIEKLEEDLKEVKEMLKKLRR
ncbi:NifB/NifX family molybdenum-iron cluster-binding protein [Candidatus Alkanophaga liquidiphilum]|nr:putative Fe-Mo cluster-binding protein [Candidatus Alkanophaga liquidiphilum]